MENASRIRYVDSYVHAPASAEYILRDTCSYGVVLEYYKNDMCTHLFELDIPSCLFQDYFEDIISRCLNIIGPRKILYIEKPCWMQTLPTVSDEEEYDEDTDETNEDDEEKYAEWLYLEGSYEDEEDDFT